MSTPPYIDTIVGVVLYQDHVKRAIMPNRWANCGDAIAEVQASRSAWIADTEANNARCSATMGKRNGVSGNRVASRNTNGSITASRIHLGVVDAGTVSQSSGKPCVTETRRASSALIPPSTRQTHTTARLAISHGRPAL